MSFFCYRKKSYRKNDGNLFFGEMMIDHNDVTYRVLIVQKICSEGFFLDQSTQRLLGGGGRANWHEMESAPACKSVQFGKEDSIIQ